MSKNQGDEGKEPNAGSTDKAPRSAVALAGLELDLAVHKRVMGATWPTTRCRVCGWSIAASSKFGCVEGNCSERPIPTKRADTPPAYSTDIAAAMTLIEKLRSSGEWCCIQLKSDYHYVWWVALTRAEGSTRLNADHKPTLAREDESHPVAICRAALAAIEASNQRAEGGTTE